MPKPPRVGQVISLTFTNDTEPSEAFDNVTIVRKELPCDRYLVRDGNGKYFILFTSKVNGRWWDAEDAETDKLNGEA